MKKRIFAIVLAAMMVVAMMPFTAFAAGPAMTLTVDSVSAEATPGTEVRVPVNATSESGYGSGALHFTWDPSALVFTGIEWTEQCPDLGSPEPANSGDQGMRFGDSLAKTNFDGNGLMFTLIFTVADGAQLGDYTVAIDDSTVSIQDADIAVEDLTVTTVAGTVTLVEPTEPETEPVTEAPATEAPATEAPATEAPATEAPATEAPATPDSGKSPKTGDASNMGMWIVLMTLTAAAVVTLVAMKRKGVFSK